MKAKRSIASFAGLRDRPVWRLLSADNGPIIMGLLQSHLLDEERGLPSSVFHTRIHRDLEELRSGGESLPQSAQAYVADWLRNGYLERRFPEGASEELYLLSAEAASAIRFISGLSEPRMAATESRLAVVIAQLVRLAEETDPDPESRVKSLKAERRRITQEIEAIQSGRLDPLSEERAIEHAREAIVLAEELSGDFRRVRERFEALNRNLREKLAQNDGSRGEVLGDLFGVVDVISNSEEGRTFSAFWNLLIDPIQSTALEEAIESILKKRAFSKELSHRERLFLGRLTHTLLDQGGAVHDVLQNFARSLKQFVQSREYLEQRRLHQTLREAERLALSLKEEVKATDTLEYTLELTSSRVRSLSQWVLHDPAAHRLDGSMKDARDAPADFETIRKLFDESEIDFRTLKNNIREVLSDREQASISQILARFPAAQGLGSVVGYVALGSRHGLVTGQNESVSWTGKDGELRRASIPTLFFLKERLNELQ